jgi:hypothetical protein
MIIKRNNPGNIRKSKSFAWQGEVPGQKEGSYVVFDSLVNGYRAQIKLLNNYIIQGKDTITKIITKYAPPSDNNPTADYISYVSKKTGIDDNQKLAANNFDVLAKIALAMSFFEHGIKNDDGTLSSAIDNAKNLLSRIEKGVTDNPLMTAAIIATLYYIVQK